MPSFYGDVDSGACATLVAVADVQPETYVSGSRMKPNTLPSVPVESRMVSRTADPDLVSLVGGGNDILRPSVDLDALAERFDAAVAKIRASGADVLLCTPIMPATA